MQSLFSKGFKGLSDTKFSGVPGSVYRSVGVDHKSEPGLLKVQQKLTKDSASVVDELCTSRVQVDDTKRLWFGGAKAFLDNNGTYTEKLELSQITRDLLFTKQESSELGVASSIVRFGDSGRRLYVYEKNNSHLIRQYTLTTAYDVSTKEQLTSFTVSSSVVNFIVSETRLFLLEADTVTVYRIAGWNLNRRQEIDSWDISSQTTDAIDLAFNAAGTALYVLDEDGTVYEYTLSTGFGAYPAFRYLLVGGGGGGGGAQGETFEDPIHRGGVGGGGGVDEDANAWLTPGVSHTISVGAGGTGGAAGANSGTVGGDTVAFGITVKGGGYGARSASLGTGAGYQSTYNGGDGGNGGGGGWWDDNDDTPQYGRSGNVLGSSKKQVGEYGSATGRLAGATNHVSDITGTEVTYSANQIENATANSNGAAATTIGQGGGNGYTDTNATDRSGGNGYAGIAVIRFKTADVSYSQTGGTVTTSGDDTIITWTPAASGTFEWTLSAQASYNTSHSFPAATAFAVESGRAAFIVGDTVTQYTITGFDLSTASLTDNVLLIDTDNETVKPSSLVLTDEYAFVGFETHESTTSRSLSRYSFVTSNTDILAAALFAPTKTTDATTPVVFDSFGHSHWKFTSTNKQSGTSLQTFDLGEVGDRPSTGSSLSAAYAKAVSTQDISVRLRGYLNGAQTGTSAAIQATDGIYPNIGYLAGTDTLQTVAFDTVMLDAMIVGDVASQTNCDGAETVYQRIGFARDTQIDAIDLKLREGQRLNGGYSLVLEVQDSAGTVVATDTLAIGVEDIGITEKAVRFTFTAVTLKAGEVYTVRLEVDSVAGENFNLEADRYLVWVSRNRGVNTYALMDGTVGDLELQMRLLDTSISETDADTDEEPRVYFATNKMLFYIKASDVTGTWSGNIYTVGEFENGHATHHPMLVQNRQLYIGDDTVMAQVDETGTYIAQTDFNVEGGETIQTLVPFDIDVLVGTKRTRDGRALRWDGISESWYAEDILPEKGGVQAFLKDDNFVYAIGGYKGRIYYYDGAKLHVFKSLPELTGTNEIQVQPNAVGFFMNAPVFGVSHKTGTALLQGVYALGSYSEQYAKVLTLDFPVPTKEFSNVTIGAILVEDTDLYIAYQTATETGIAKLDWTAKYDAAYIETRVLTPGEVRHQIKTLTEVAVPYYALPSGTSITMGIKAAYDATYTDFTTEIKTDRHIVEPARSSVPNVANPQIRVQLGVNSNDAPEIEDVLFDIAPIGKR